MINRHTHNGVTWIDLQSPTHEEARQIMDEFHIDPLVAEEMLLPSLKPRVEIAKEYLYLILHFPAFKHSHLSTPNQEIDFLIGHKFLVTVRYDTVEPLHVFASTLEVHSILEKEDIGNHAGMLFYRMLRTMYGALEHELDFMRDELADIEAKIFAGKEREMVVALSNVSRGLLNFLHAVSKHREVLESFTEVAGRFFGDDYAQYANLVLGQQYRVHNEILNRMNSLTELRETNNALLSTKQNEIMKTLTIMAFVTFPLTLVTNLFGMNTIYLPIVGNPNDFWIIISIMLT